MVLNGTSTNGLAHSLSNDLQQGGYTQATAMDGTPPGSHATTVVEYTSGHRAEAQGVASALSVTQVQPIEAAVSSLAGAATVVVSPAKTRPRRSAKRRGRRGPPARAAKTTRKRPARAVPRASDRGMAPPAVAAPFLDLPERSQKPRERGLTHVIDRGLSVAEVDGLLEVAGAAVDIVKLGWGTALVSENLRPSWSATRRTGSPSCWGGR